MATVTYKPVSNYGARNRPEAPIRKRRYRKPRASSRSSTDWTNEYVGGYLHGLKTYKRRKLYTSDPYKKPTICTNRKYAYQPNGTSSMKFICPLADQSSLYKVCCGERGFQFCCISTRVGPGKITGKVLGPVSAFLVISLIFIGCQIYRKRRSGATPRRPNRRNNTSQFIAYIHRLTGRPQPNEQQTVPSARSSEQPRPNVSEIARTRDIQNRLMYDSSGQPDADRPSSVRIPLVAVAHSSIIRPSAPPDVHSTFYGPISASQRNFNNRLIYGNRGAPDSDESLTVRMPLVSPIESNSTIPIAPRIEHLTQIVPGSAQEREIIDRLLYRRPQAPAPSISNVTFGEPSEYRRHPLPTNTTDRTVHIPTASESADLPPIYAEVAASDPSPPQYNTLTFAERQNNPAVSTTATV